MKNTAFKAADILLPRVSDLKRWSVVACDQYTSEREYWDAVEAYVGKYPSTLRLVLPEIYLGKADTGARIKSINKNIREYMAAGVFEEYKNAMIYVERVQSDGRVRRGLIGAIDLEEYDFRPGSRSQVRATEATVIERIPPRLEIRRDADIELPHIMILIDDPAESVIDPFAKKTASLTKLYETDLMGGGGSISGYLLKDDDIAAVESALEKLGEGAEMLFAMGDGNHSLATAKAHYEALKQAHPNEDMSNHPARYALCELVNLRSEALEFEAIHRIVKVDDPYKFIIEMSLKLELSGVPSGQHVRIHRNFSARDLYIQQPLSKLAVGSIQAFIDDYIRENGGEVDYIHGEDTLRRLATEDTIGFEFEPMRKEELFPAVIADGSLPRKTFSMGHAADKRYYLEARKIVK